MRTYSHQQAGLFSWFRYDPESFRSFETIERVCIKAFEPGEEDPVFKYAVYNIFYPLLRWGVVEFYGDNRFRISPPAVLKYNNRVLVCHPTEQMERQLVHHRLESGRPGISVYENCKEVQAFCNASGIAIRRFEICGLLSNTHSLEQVILSWQDDQVIDITGYIAIDQSHSHGVGRQTETPYTIYKKSDKAYAARTIQMQKGLWKIIPDRKSQIDAFAIARLLCRIYNGDKLLVTYNEEKQVVSVREYSFPIVLERLLSINTMLSENRYADLPGRVYHLERGAFLFLNQILHGAIQIV